MLSLLACISHHFTAHCRNWLCCDWSDKLELYISAHNKPAGLRTYIKSQCVCGLTLHSHGMTTMFNWHSSWCLVTVITHNVYLTGYSLLWLFSQPAEITKRQVPSVTDSFQLAKKCFQQPHGNWKVIYVSKWLGLNHRDLSDRFQLPTTFDTVVCG